MNLEKLNVQELSIKELKKVGGGIPWYVLVGLGLAILNTDWDQAWGDFKRGAE